LLKLQKDPCSIYRDEPYGVMPFISDTSFGPKIPLQLVLSASHDAKPTPKNEVLNLEKANLQIWGAQRKKTKKTLQLNKCVSSSAKGILVYFSTGIAMLINSIYIQY